MEGCELAAWVISLTLFPIGIQIPSHTLSVAGFFLENRLAIARRQASGRSLLYGILSN